MTHFGRFLQVFALGTWIGGIILLSFVVAPGAFRILPNIDQAGMTVGFVLSRLHTMGMILGVVYLIASVAAIRSISGLIWPAALLVILMIILTFVSENFVTSKMDRLRQQMGPVEATPSSSPLRQQFDRLHPISVTIEGVVLLAGIVSLFLTA